MTAQTTTRSSTLLTDFEGTPAELLSQFGGVIDGVDFQQVA